MKYRFFSFFYVMTLLSWGQEQSLNYNDYYQFPLSLGVEYQTKQPLGGFSENFNILDIGTTLRYPFTDNPVFQPFVKGGLINFDSTDQSFPDKWDHYHIYGLLGMGFTNRFAKNFEVGADVQAGLSEAVFPNAVDSGSVGAPYMQLAAAAKITLNPSYSFSIDINPTVGYQKALSDFDKYDGPFLGIGFGVNFRFGEDPDSAGAIIRNIRFDELFVAPVFSAMQSYYVNNPVGQVTLTNTSRSTLSDVQVSFMQAGFMDSATVSARIPQLEPGSEIMVDLLATYNQQVFTTNGITPLTGEVIVSYNIKGRQAEQRESVTYDLYDKTSITWEDDNKIGAFITPADSALQNYVSFIRKASNEKKNEYYSDPLQLAMQVYAGLQQIGMIYQIDPISPFTRAQEDALVVDSVKLPRETLSRGTGDCDDLTALFCALLEAAGVETGFITVPGHIYPVVNTGYNSRQYPNLHPDRDMTIDVDGMLWVPVEITSVGTGAFLEAWRLGASLWKQYGEEDPQRNFYRTRESQTVYRPVGLRESDLGLQYGNSEALAAAFSDSLSRVGNLVTGEFARIARESGDPKDYNRAGMAYARFGNTKDGEYYFNQALKRDKAFIPAQINLGNIAFVGSRFSQAIEAFQEAYKGLVDRGMDESSTAVKLLINLSKAFYQMADYSEAQGYFDKASTLNPDLTSQFAYLGNGDGATRASEISGSQTIIFIEE
jgi:hypothetical protein